VNLTLAACANAASLTAINSNELSVCIHIFWSPESVAKDLWASLDLQPKAHRQRPITFADASVAASDRNYKTAMLS
jgi:hypothetical protein